jgi:hypothetical protein
LEISVQYTGQRVLGHVFAGGLALDPNGRHKSLNKQMKIYPTGSADRPFGTIGNGRRSGINKEDLTGLVPLVNVTKT